MAFNSKICTFFPLLLLFFNFRTIISATTDTISESQSLSGNKAIVSKAGKFELGFFSPGNTGNLYVGIWFKTVSKRAFIWVANRENPVSSASTSEFKISEDKNLVVLNQSKLPVWSSNCTQKPISSVVAVLLDTGNLVLRNQQNSSDIIWQSFDHPTDTVMSGQWFGINKITGEYQSLAPWKDPEDPAAGPFTERVDPFGSGQFVVLWNQSKVYWQSGHWTGQAFTSIPGMPLNTNYSYDFVNDDHYLRIRYTTRDMSIITRRIISTNGQLQRYTWSEKSDEWILQYSLPSEKCNVYSVCGYFGVCNTGSEEYCFCLPGFKPASPRSWDLGAWSEGCVRKTDLRCFDSNKSSDKKEQDGFLKISNMKLPESSKTLQVASIDECKSACLSNCTCIAYAYEGDCIIWNSNLQDLKQLSDGNTEAADFYIRLAASDLPDQGNNKTAHTMRLVILLAVGGILMVLCTAVGTMWISNRRKLIQKAIADDGSLVLFDYASLQHCTKNFSDKLGQGSFGSVFKGVLSNSTEVAVKKLQGLRQGEKQFQTEVRTLGRIQHTNLVRLCGFCLRGAERLLVYDYMPNGSLDSHLFRSHANFLDWKTRFKVILGIARGLAYLHEECHECIIHCDIKPENVLLDTDFSPKVADFGLAKLIDRDFSRALTTARGTLGYLAPEWIQGLPITPKADVYSYGMMLFEIISGRRNKEQMEDRNVGYFPVWAAKQISEGDVLAVLDDRLEGDADVQELDRACRVACWCIQDNEACRPTMGQVVQILQGTQKVGLAPIPRSLQQLVEGQDFSY